MVLITAVVPGGRAVAAGLKEGDYFLSVNVQPCQWWKHTEVVAQLRAASEAIPSLQVVSLLPGPMLPAAGDWRPALPLRSQRQRGGEPASVPPSPWRLLGWSRMAKVGLRPCPDLGRFPALSARGSCDWHSLPTTIIKHHGARGKVDTKVDTNSTAS